MLNKTLLGGAFYENYLSCIFSVLLRQTVFNGNRHNNVKYWYMQLFFHDPCQYNYQFYLYNLSNKIPVWVGFLL